MFCNSLSGNKHQALKKVSVGPLDASRVPLCVPRMLRPVVPDLGRAVRGAEKRELRDALPFSRSDGPERVNTELAGGQTSWIPTSYGKSSTANYLLNIAEPSIGNIAQVFGAPRDLRGPNRTRGMSSHALFIPSFLATCGVHAYPPNPQFPRHSC